VSGNRIVTAIGHQFTTLTVDNCVLHGGREALLRAGQSAAAKTCIYTVSGKRCHYIL